MKDKFESAREMFPHTTDIVYFNTAAYGPLPEKTKKAIVENINGYYKKLKVVKTKKIIQ